MYSPKHHQLQSIGIFDSGVGGLTVMQQVIKHLPKENVVYFGDTARLPYGNKSRETIIRYSIENSIFLLQHNIKVLLIACHTASSVATERLRQIFNIPVVGVIEPGAEKAVQMTRNKRIAVLGTRGTINAGVYQQEIKKRLEGAHVLGIACPLFVHVVEESMTSHEAAKLIVKEYLAPLHKENVDTVLLGCTHYPMLSKLIAEELGPNVTIVDPAIAAAEHILEILNIQNWHNSEKLAADYKFYVSDDPEKFRKLGCEFLGIPLKHVEAATLH